MKIAFAALVMAALFVPQFVRAEIPDNRKADQEYELLLGYEFEKMPAPPEESCRGKVRDPEQNKKIIISIIPDSRCLPPADCP